MPPFSGRATNVNSGYPDLLGFLSKNRQKKYADPPSLPFVDNRQGYFGSVVGTADEPSDPNWLTVDQGAPRLMVSSVDLGEIGQL